ncbi:RNA polymerase sigma factor [Caulobacter sp.]|uniref:RNA polymerase sigma factor n=1 Tax=Caulobacter sp. TaxID=78 RepID=UPI003BAF3A30
MAWLRDIDRWFGARVLPHASGFRAYALRLTGDEGDAEDLVQEAYARVLSLADWRRLEAPERFVLTIIRNLAFERFRRAKVVGIRQIGVLDLETLPDPAPDAYVATTARQELDRVLAAMDRLPPQCRKVLTLRKIEALAPRDIAVRLGLSVSTVEKHLSKALRLLTEALAEDEDGSIKSRPGSWLSKARKTERR